MGISGTCDDRISGVRDVFASNFEPKDAIYDDGASVAITVSSSLTCGVAPPTAMPASRFRGKADTIINVWSTTKTVAALACLMLADQGRLDLYAPVADVWPEFTAEGKGDIEVRHVMSHTAGLPGWQEPITYEDIYDHRRAADMLAAQAPWWEPGTASGYHAITQGHLEGEIVQRVTGQSLGQFVAEHITGPLGADFFIGTPPSADRRVAHIVAPPPLAIPEDVDPGSVLAKTFSNPELDATKSWDVAWRRAEIPAAGGHGNARWSPRSTPRWRAAVRPIASGCSARRRLAPCSTSSATESTSCSGCRCAMASASACRRGRPAAGQRQHVLLGRLGRLAGDHRSRRPDELQLRDEQDGRGHRRRPTWRRPAGRRLRRPRLIHPSMGGHPSVGGRIS